MQANQCCLDPLFAMPSLQSSAGDVVILVHGTFAARNMDEGDSWWQRGSEPWQGLSERLPSGVNLQNQGRLFHWSGENSERSRIKAAGDLLDEMLQLESSGRRYHLVGHSHGGSVIWHALRMATLHKNALEGLRSWSTVGTPFLQHRTRSPWHIVNLVKIVVAASLIWPAMLTLWRFALLVSALLFGTDHGFTLPEDGGTGWITKNPGPAVDILKLCGVPTEQTAEGLRIGSYDPSVGQSIVDYVFFTSEGWLILVIALSVAYVYLNLAKYCIGPVLESLRIRAEERLERRAMHAFKGRWLGLWSPDDEAINGLRATLDLSISFVSKMAPRDKVLLSDRIAFISRPHRWVFAPLYNSLVRPILDRTVRSHVIKTAQGNNRPAAEVVAVSAAPTESVSTPHLPAWLNEKLAEEADQHAKVITPELRRLLAAPCIVGGLETFSHTISGRELIHTSYFDHPEVLDLLALHIAWASGKPARVHRHNQRSVELKTWLDEFKTQLNHRAKTNRWKMIVPRRRHAA